jgi:hypothetical protein
MGASPYRRYSSAAHPDRCEIPVKNTTYVPKTTTYREYTAFAKEVLEDDKVKDYFPSGYSIEKMQEVITKLLESYQAEWKRKKQRDYVR